MSILKYFSTISGLVPAIAALVRYRNSPTLYRPFFWLLWLGSLNDLGSNICAHVFRNNLVNSNCWVLLDFCMLLYIFYRWNGSVKRYKYLLLGAIGFAIWIIDNLVLHTLWKSINSIYRIYYCLVVMFMSMDLINRLIIFERRKLIRNPQFLICVTFILFYSFKAFIESFYVFQLSKNNPAFGAGIFLILKFMNVFSNLIFTIAILCIPKRQEFSLR